MSLLNCIIYLVISGIIIFFIGRIIPRKWIKEQHFPFRLYKFEKNGKIYEILKIKLWKTKLPDASVIINKIIPGFMPKKRLDTNSKEKLEILVKEGCIAEINHWIAGVLGFVCIKIWNKVGGTILSIMYLIWNLLFVFIQRYNRPRLIKALNKMQKECI